MKSAGRNPNDSLIFDLGLDSQDVPAIRNAILPLDSINVLTQVRKKFDGMEELEENIKSLGLLEPPIVAEFSRERAEEYLCLLNAIWKTRYEIGDLIPKRGHGKTAYYILLGGERRIRSLRRINPKAVIDARIFKDIPANLGVFIQFSENSYRPPSKQEQARGYHAYFSFIRKMKPDYPLARFARLVGRDEETIRSALKYCELPENVRRQVEEKSRYGIGVELARLHQAGEQNLEFWLETAILEKMSVPRFRQEVSNYLNSRSSGQMNLDLVFDEKREEIARKNHRRKVVAQNLLFAFWNDKSYIRAVLRLLEEGAIGGKGSPFSEKSPSRAYRELAEMMKSVSGHFRFICPKMTKEAEKIFIEAELLAKIVEQKIEAGAE